MNTGLGRLDGVELIVDRRSRAGKVENLIDLYIERKGNIVPLEFETRIVEQLKHVITRSRKEVIDAKDIMPVVKQTLAQMRSKKSGAAGY